MIMMMMIIIIFLNKYFSDCHMKDVSGGIQTCSELTPADCEAQHRLPSSN